MSVINSADSWVTLVALNSHPALAFSLLVADATAWKAIVVLITLDIDASCPLHLNDECTFMCWLTQWKLQNPRKIR